MIYAQNILLCLTIPFLVTLLFLRGKTRQFVVFFIFGILICLIASCISAFFNDVSEMGGKDVAVYISPIVEEIMKFFPLLFYLILCFSLLLLFVRAITSAGNQLVALGDFNEVILWLDIVCAYCARYQQHKEAGLQVE